MTTAIFENVFCRGEVYQTENKDIVLKGKVNEAVQDNMIYFIAANPPDYRASYTGSGLPFANQVQAFESTPNKGAVPIVNNEFEIKVMYPNSYYVGLGTVIVPPTIFIEYMTPNQEKRNVSVKISDGIPYRMLTYPMQNTLPRSNAMFYKYGWEMPVRTQEEILRDSAYPRKNEMASNFWGLKPPL